MELFHKEPTSVLERGCRAPAPALPDLTSMNGNV